MNNEQFERRMEFIVEQQAQFTIDIQKLQEAQAELTKKHNHLTEALTTVVGMVGRLQQAQQDLTEAQQGLTEAQRDLSIKHGETDERLNSLINIVERFISGNGQKGVTKRRNLKLGTRRPSGKKPDKK